jgi:hypothetical protein
VAGRGAGHRIRPRPGPASEKAEGDRGSKRLTLPPGVSRRYRVPSTSVAPGTAVAVRATTPCTPAPSARSGQATRRASTRG